MHNINKSKMENNFNLKKFLVENKLTTNSKQATGEVNEFMGLFGGGAKFKDGDKVYITQGGRDGAEFETTPRKINLRTSKGKPIKEKGKTMYYVTSPEHQNQFFTSGGIYVDEKNIKPA
jgi:hypothetical protein